MPIHTKAVKQKLLKVYNRAVNAFQYREGVAAMEKILKLHPELADENILCKLGLLYDHWALRQKFGERRKLESQAFRLYRQALRLNPNSAKALWGIGRVWWHRKSRKALPYALRAYRLRKRNNEPVGLYPQHIGLIYEFLGNYRKAEYWLLRGAKENSKDYGSYLNLVVFYKFVKNLKQARKHAVKLKKLYEREPREFRKTPWGKKISAIIAETLNYDPEPKKSRERS